MANTTTTKANATPATAKEMTSRQFYQAVIKANVSAILTEYAELAIKKMDEKNEARKGSGSKRARENEPIKAEILAKLTAGKVYTGNEVFALGIEGVESTNKVNALLSQLGKDGKLIVSTVKVKGKSPVKGYALPTETQSAD